MNTGWVCYKYQVSFFVCIISFSSWVRAHQNRGKSIDETFVKDYIVFSLVVKVKLLFILQTVLKSKTYDPRLVWPYSLLLCGPTSCGKTTWIVELLKSCEELCTHMPKKLIWIYGVEQPDLFKTIKEIWAPHQCEFVEGFLKIWCHDLKKTNDRGSLCIFDDVMNEVSSNATILKLFTRGRSHLECSLVLMLQNIFPKGSQSRTISINAQYQVLFRNPIDSLQISILARQLCPLNSKDFLKICKRATQRPYGYLFCCFTQSCPNEIHYRTNVLPCEYPSIVYQLLFYSILYKVWFRSRIR